MTTNAIATIILAAGQGTRMKSAKSKVLHEIGGRSLLAHVMACATALSPECVAVVIGDHAQEVGDAAIAEIPTSIVAIQAPPRGTGDAVAKALPALEGFDGVVMVLYADTPLVKPETLRALAAFIQSGKSAAVLGFRTINPGTYGRLVVDDQGELDAIVEAKDATSEQLAIDLVNSGVMAIDAKFLRSALPQLRSDNAKGEYYLTDIIAIARGEGKLCGVLEVAKEEVIGVNSRIELATAEEIFQERCRVAAMNAGVTLIDPSTVFFSFDTQLASDVVVEPHVFFGPGVIADHGARVKGFSHVEGAHIGADAMIGPFARVRPGTVIGKEAKIGNFVEIKKTELGDGAKVSHLTYLGDANIGAAANIGAGTITCNYDGFNKHVTTIGDGAFIGSNSALVAPVKIGDGAYVGSGSVITKDVEPAALSVARARQCDFPDWAERFRNANKK